MFETELAKPLRSQWCCRDSSGSFTRVVKITHKSQISGIINSNHLSPTIIKSKMMNSVTQSRTHSKLMSATSESTELPATLVVKRQWTRTEFPWLLGNTDSSDSHIPVQFSDS